MIGKRLTLLRVENEESITEAAEDIGVSKSSLRAYEAGRKMPDEDILEKIAKHYDVSVSSILGESPDPEDTGEDSAEKLCPLKIKEVRHAKTGDTTRWFQPCLKEKCMAYGSDGFCQIFSENKKTERT